MSFKGFPTALPKFLQSLAANNNREWFEDNKSEYQRVFVEPTLDFINALQPIVSRFSPPHIAEARLNGSLRRIHRDVRFSKDKTPYNPRLHLIFWTGGHPNRSPASHVVLSGKHLGFGAGQWGFDKSQIDRFRAAINNSEKLRGLEKALNQANSDNLHLDKPALKRLPNGFEAATGLQAELARHKGVVVRNSEKPFDAAVFSSDCLAYFEKRMRNALPLNKWLLDEVN